MRRGLQTEELANACLLRLQDSASAACTSTWAT